MSPTPLRGNRDFVLLQVGQALSTLGSESSLIAYPLLVLALTHSPAKAGIVGFARFAPYVVVAIPAGVAVDRWNRKRLMLLADAGPALALGSLVVALAFGSLGFAQIAIVAFVEGALFALFNIAETGALRSVVPAAQLPRATATEQARLASVQLCGAPLGGVLFGVARLLPFLVDALSYAFSLASLLAMRTPFQEQRDPRAAARVRDEAAEGLRWLWRHRFLRTCALLGAASNFVFEALFLAAIVVARRQGLSPGSIGGLIAAIGAVGVLGSLAAPALQRRLSVRAIMLAELWPMLAVVAFVTDPSVYVLLAGALPVVFFVPAGNSTVIAYRIGMTPDRLVGRVNSVARTVALSGAPLGSLTAGFLLGGLSARVSVAALLAVALALAVWGTLSSSLRNAPSLDELADLPSTTVTPAASRAAGG